MAKTSWRPSPHATTCQRMALRLLEMATPIPMMSAMPKRPESRVVSGVLVWATVSEGAGATRAAGAGAAMRPMPRPAAPGRVHRAATAIRRKAVARIQRRRTDRVIEAPPARS